MITNTILSKKWGKLTSLFLYEVIRELDKDILHQFVVIINYIFNQQIFNVALAYKSCY